MVTSLGYAAETAGDGEEALQKLGAGAFDALITDLMMPRMDGFGLLRTLLDRGDLTPAVVLTGFGSIREALRIVHDLHAFWFLEKPAEMVVLAPLLERAIRHKGLIVEADRLQRQLSRDGFLQDLVGKSDVMKRVFSVIQQVAPTSASVLITGESGTGKERAAAAIHKLSPRSAGPFVAVNCAAIPESLTESELFGHEKGAFTGAVGRQAGCFEQAHHGTLFLDEISEMPVAIQAKLLRVLEDSRVRRLGGSQEISVDVRVLAASNRPIEEAVEKKALRPDLYYRLNVITLPMPPLRHHMEDLPLIAENLIHSLNERNDCRVVGLDPAALAVLMDHTWPGNVRELRNVLERAVILAGDGPIMPKHLPRTFAVSGIFYTGPARTSAQRGLTFGPGMSLREVEEAYIRFTLDQNGNNRARAAASLGIGVRTLYNRLSDAAHADRPLGEPGGNAVPRAAGG